MNNSKLCTIAEATKLIQDGGVHFLAGDENLLMKMPKGNWIGGTTPYFMAETGGVVTKDKVYVTSLPKFITQIETKFLSAGELDSIYSDTPRNGFTFIIIPVMSEVLMNYSLNAHTYKDFAVYPVVGWVAGALIDELSVKKGCVFDGKSNQSSDSKALVMRVTLPEDYLCDIGILNIFNQGDGDTIIFNETGFSAGQAKINGLDHDFYDYLKQKNLDLRLPLVADYGGAMINTSFYAVDDNSRMVLFPAPVFKGIEYRQAKLFGDYKTEFIKNMPESSENIFFSCNCILNFIASELEGKKINEISGPIVFGEIAYQLLNQTMVYLSLIKK